MSSPAAIPLPISSTETTTLKTLSGLNIIVDGFNGIHVGGVNVVQTDVMAFERHHSHDRRHHHAAVLNAAVLSANRGAGAPTKPRAVRRGRGFQCTIALGARAAAGPPTTRPPSAVVDRHGGAVEDRARRAASRPAGPAAPSGSPASAAARRRPGRSRGRRARSAPPRRPRA